MCRAYTNGRSRLLIALVVVLGAFAALKARIARAPEPGEFERPPEPRR